MRIRSVVTVVTTLGLVTSSGGCGGSGLVLPPLGKVRGTVAHNGKPLTSGTVTFTPITGKGAEGGHVATGEVESDGSYVLTTFDTGDGAVLGQHAVSVVAHEGGTMSLKDLNTPKGADTSNMHNVKPKYVLPKASTPKKYASPTTTPLKYTVREGQNVFDLELKD